MKKFVLLFFVICNSSVNAQNDFYYLEFGYSKPFTSTFLNTTPELFDQTNYTSGKSFKIGLMSTTSDKHKYRVSNLIIGLSFACSDIHSNNSQMLSDLQEKYPDYQWTFSNPYHFIGGQFNIDFGYSFNYKSRIFFDVMINYPFLGIYAISDIHAIGINNSDTCKIGIQGTGFCNFLTKYSKIFEFVSLSNRVRLNFNRMGVYASFNPTLLFGDKEIVVDYNFPDDQWTSKNERSFFSCYYTVNFGITYQMKSSHHHY